VSFAKCLAPGLRIAAMIAPEAFRDRSINALRATGWMAVPVMAEVVTRLILNGGLARQAKLKRDKAALRDAIVRRILKEWLPASVGPPGFHIWLPLPAGRTLAALIAQAAQAGITLAPPGALRRMENESLGVRLCLGAPATEADLERALIEIRRILEWPKRSRSSDAKHCRESITRTLRSRPCGKPSPRLLFLHHWRRRLRSKPRNGRRVPSP